MSSSSRVHTDDALIPANEPERLAAVRRYDVLDTPPDGAFDRLTAAAARLFSVPISIVSIVDSDRIWFKSHHGLDVYQIDRDPGLCASAILHEDTWVVENAAVDARTLANPLVAGGFGLRFYAGAPLKTHDGYNLGTLCIIDKEPRTLSEEEIATLQDLASVVMDELELRLSARNAIALETESRRTAEELAIALQESLLPHELPAIPGLEIASRYHVAYKDRVGGDFYDVIPTDSGCAAVVGDACGKGAKAAAITGMARWALRTASLNEWPPAKVLSRLNEVIARAHTNPERYLTVALANFTIIEKGAEMTLALGGHPHPLIVRQDGGVESAGTTAPIVGWRREIAFTDSTVVLDHGDLVVIFTDGLQETVDGPSGTSQRLQEALASMAGMDPTSVADRLDQMIGDDLRDDAAFLIIRVA